MGANRFVLVETVTNVPGFLPCAAESKAPEHQRTPKRKREMDMELAAIPRLRESAVPPLRDCAAFLALELTNATRRFQVKEFAKQIRGFAALGLLRVARHQVFVDASRALGNQTTVFVVANHDDPIVDRFWPLTVWQ